MSSKKRLASWPNILTSLRILLIPIFVVVYFVPYSWADLATALLFIGACLTDWFDGYLARKLRQESSFGAFLDPVADKLIVVVALVLLVQSYSTVVFSLPALVIISREIVVSALRELMAQHGSSKKVAVAYVGKVKTFLQMTSIAIILSQPHYLDWSNPIASVGIVALYLAVVLTLWSMCVYLHAARYILMRD